MSCNKSMKDEFGSTIIAYQKEFPVLVNEKESGSNKMYLYHAFFQKQNNDTLFGVCRTYSKIENGLYEGQKIHENDKMKPLVITDIFKISGDLTDSKIKKQQLSFWHSGTGEDEQHTPIYLV